MPYSKITYIIYILQTALRQVIWKNLTTNKIFQSPLILQLQTVNTGIVSGLMLCSLQNKRNLLRNWQTEAKMKRDGAKRESRTTGRAREN